MIKSNKRERERQRKEKILDNFILAEALAVDIAELIFSEKEPKIQRPWDYYQTLFSEEKSLYEEIEKQRALEEYKEQRKKYVEEYNRRRQQGI